MRPKSSCDSVFTKPTAAGSGSPFGMPGLTSRSGMMPLRTKPRPAVRADHAGSTNIWSTTGACDPTPEQFDALNADTIARENGALRAWLNPVRHCMFDRLDVREAGDDRTFGGITGTWMGVASSATMMQATVEASYCPGYIYRKSTFTFNSGSEVYLLDAPDGEVFVMESVSRRRDPTLSEDNLAHLASRLDLPAGWGLRAEMLDQDLQVSSNPDNLAHVLQDNLHNVYQGSDVGRAFSQLLPEDSLR